MSRVFVMYVTTTLCFSIKVSQKIITCESTNQGPFNIYGMNSQIYIGFYISTIILFYTATCVKKRNSAMANIKNRKRICFDRSTF